MRKVLIVMVLVGLVLGVLPGAVSATPVDELTALAQYFPATAPVFAAMRTDAGFVETLDAMAARISSAIPGAGVPGRLSAMLDLAAQQIDQEGDFQSVFRSWMGDTAAFALLSLEPQGGSSQSVQVFGSPQFVAALSVTNREAAEDFADTFLRQMDADFSVTTEDPFTLFEVEDENVAVAVTDDALFLTENVDTLESLNTREARLNTFGAFTDTIGALPNGDYDLVVYFDTPSLMNAAMEMNMPRSNRPNPMLTQMGGLMSATAPQAVGISLVNGSGLLFDSAQLASDMSALEELGFVLPTELPPVNFDFAANIPADAPFVILGTNLAETYDLVIENLRAALTLQEEMGNVDADELEEFEDGMRFLDIGIRGLTGLDLREDILGWMTGGYGLFFNVNPAALDDPTSVMPLDFGLVFEATDPAAAQAVVDGIREAITQAEPDDVTLTQETVAGVDAAVIVGEPDDEPYPVEILIGSNDNVFVIGTRNAFTGVFEAGGGLAADPAFTTASSYFLPGSAALFYFSPQPLTSIADLLAASEDDEMQEGAGVIQLLSALLDSGSITASYNADGSRARFVLSLAG
jgi:hypothetical protein